MGETARFMLPGAWQWPRTAVEQDVPSPTAETGSEGGEGVDGENGGSKEGEDGNVAGEGGEGESTDCWRLGLFLRMLEVSWR